LDADLEDAVLASQIDIEVAAAIILERGHHPLPFAGRQL
jgi:hypothetical protein